MRSRAAAAIAPPPHPHHPALQRRGIRVHSPAAWAAVRARQTLSHRHIYDCAPPPPTCSCLPHQAEGCAIARQRRTGAPPETDGSKTGRLAAGRKHAARRCSGAVGGWERLWPAGGGTRLSGDDGSGCVAAGRARAARQGLDGGTRRGADVPVAWINQAGERGGAWRANKGCSPGHTVRSIQGVSQRCVLGWRVRVRGRDGLSEREPLQRGPGRKPASAPLA